MADIIPTNVVDESQDPVEIQDLPSDVGAFKANGVVYVRVRGSTGEGTSQGFNPLTAQVTSFTGTTLVLPFEIGAGSSLELSGPIAI